ncbi:hypothetical protein GOP47_0007887 [Adiantum capillus-veneris]|uniref:Uncharacterized protein n=1 Tax=Adiantum capillus-veneris TaxID=13818 RepID=A0A9D4V2H5_ADICA|nr:hypothetical protein GOP47_0007887 [Adiantum capillus-veneris]
MLTPLWKCKAFASKFLIKTSKSMKNNLPTFPTCYPVNMESSSTPALHSNPAPSFGTSPFLSPSSSGTILSSNGSGFSTVGPSSPNTTFTFLTPVSSFSTLPTTLPGFILASALTNPFALTAQSNTLTPACSSKKSLFNTEEIQGLTASSLWRNLISPLLPRSKGAKSYCAPVSLTTQKGVLPNNPSLLLFVLVLSPPHSPLPPPPPLFAPTPLLLILSPLLLPSPPFLPSPNLKSLSKLYLVHYKSPRLLISSFLKQNLTSKTSWLIIKLPVAYA